MTPNNFNRTSENYLDAATDSLITVIGGAMADSRRYPNYAEMRQAIRYIIEAAAARAIADRINEPDLPHFLIPQAQ